MDNNTKPDFLQKQYKRLKVSQELAYQYTQHAVKTCCKMLKGAQLELRLNKNNQAYYSGLIKCHSVWDCPHCSSIIASKRREEIGLAIDKWRLEGGKVKLITFTVRHNKKDELKNLQYAVNEAYRFSKSGAPFQRIKKRFQVQGSIVANEINYSNTAGWHYHRHEILFYKSDLDFKIYEQFIYERYYSHLVKLGFSSLPGIGVNVSKREGDLSDYLTKWGLENELTSDKKKVAGKTAFQLLDNEVDHYLFIEYSKTMRGKRRITWSNGLKDFFGINDISDDEIIEEEEDHNDTIIKYITYNEWKFIIQNDLYTEVLLKAEGDITEFYSWYLFNIKINSPGI